MNTSAEISDRLVHERLDVYRVALEFAGVARRIARSLPRTKGQLGDQLERASEGVVLKIAEGASLETGSAEQGRFFRTARGSACECAAILDLCEFRKAGSTEDRAQGRALVVRVVKMLSRLARRR